MGKLCSDCNNTVKLRDKDYLVDLRIPWQFRIEPKDVKLKWAIPDSDDTKWEKHIPGRRWEDSGHPEANGKVVWYRLHFMVPQKWTEQKVGLYIQAVDDKAEIFINGFLIGEKIGTNPTAQGGPIDVNLTQHLIFGKENLLSIRVTDFGPPFSGGLLGHIFLYRTIPYELRTWGTIKVNGKFDNLFVVLHFGEVLLAEGKRNIWNSEQLLSLHLPPYILRQEELILVLPSADLSDSTPKLCLDIRNVAPTIDHRPLSLKVQLNQNTVKLYEHLTIRLDLHASYQNPFDPNDISIQGYITTPSGRVDSVPGVFCQEFKAIPRGRYEEILLPIPNLPWRIYYTPREVGRHLLSIVVNDKTGIITSEPLSFEVVSSKHRGFLKVSTDDPHYLVFDNGEPYFGLGPSGWIVGPSWIRANIPRIHATHYFEQVYDRQSRAGKNFEYLMPYVIGKLYTAGGWIDQVVAYKIERILRLQEKYGIYWIFFHDDIRRYFVYGFNQLTYSVAQGGPCRELLQVYTQPKALQMQKNQLRYIVGRYAHSPSILAWELGDEIDNQPGISQYKKREIVQAWASELHNYLRIHDIYKHPVIIGEGRDWLPEGGDVICLPDWYFRPHKLGNDVSAQAEVMKLPFQNVSKPIINPEGGLAEWLWYHLRTWKRPFGPEMIELHNHLWASFFLQYAAGGTEWLWNHVDQYDQYYHIKALAKFLSGENFVHARYRQTRPDCSSKKLRVFGLQNPNSALLWIQHQDYTWYKILWEKCKLSPVKDATIVLSDLIKGTYVVQLWDTHTGKIIQTNEIKTTEGKLLLLLPIVTKDMAAKIKKI